MKIAILSGKGGTGKTTLSVNLFSLLDNATLIDTDIEEPNSHLFIKGEQTRIQTIHKHYPKVDATTCTLCGACGNHCQYNAIIPAKNRVIVAEDLCHDCGLCAYVCPSNAIDYHTKTIGDIYHVQSTHKDLYYGLLNTGEVSGVKLIDALKAQTEDNSFVLIDCPPGVACNTSTAIQGVDHAIIVSEPTPFGISDMILVVDLLNNAKIPFGVIINKSGIGNDAIYTYLEEKAIPIYGDIPFTRRRANLSADGKLLIEHDPTFKARLKEITARIMDVIYNA